MLESQHVTVLWPTLRVSTVEEHRWLFLWGSQMKESEFVMKVKGNHNCSSKMYLQYKKSSAFFDRGLVLNNAGSNGTREKPQWADTQRAAGDKRQTANSFFCPLLLWGKLLVPCTAWNQVAVVRDTMQKGQVAYDMFLLKHELFFYSKKYKSPKPLFPASTSLYRDLVLVMIDSLTV